MPDQSSDCRGGVSFDWVAEIRRISCSTPTQVMSSSPCQETRLRSSFSHRMSELVIPSRLVWLNRRTHLAKSTENGPLWINPVDRFVAALSS